MNGTKKARQLRQALLIQIRLEEISYTTLTFTAFNPLGPSSTSKLTLSPSVISSISPFTCTNTSLSPSSGVMNPNPFELLKNFTVPLLMLKKFKLKCKCKDLSCSHTTFYFIILSISECSEGFARLDHWNRHLKEILENWQRRTPSIKLQKQNSNKFQISRNKLQYRFQTVKFQIQNSEFKTLRTIWCPF